MLTLFIKNLEFYAYHGVSASEQQIGHRYVASISLNLEATAAESDDLGDTVDYASVGKRLIEVATASQYKTLEKLAAVIARDLLQAFSSAIEVTVRVAKVLPPVDFIAGEAGVEFTLKRN